MNSFDVGGKPKNRHDRASAGLLLGLAMGLCVTFGADAEDRIGINFTDLADSGDHLGPTDNAGIEGFAQSQWNNLDGTAGTRSDLVDDLATPVGGGFSVTWSCANTWRTTDGTSSPDQKLLKGYLDDSSAGAHVDVANIPYSLYDVILYLSSDTPNSTFDFGAYFLKDPEGNETTARVFGGDIRPFTGAYQQIPSDSINPVLADPGGNYIVFEGLSDSGFEIVGERTGSSRASLAGFQIVESLLPRISRFEADPPIVDPGQQSRLHWVVTNAVTLTIDGIDVTGQTEFLVDPLETTTYALVATNPEGSRTVQVEVAVRDLRPVIDTFVADPPTIDRGDTSTLIWSVSNATHLAVNGTDVSGATSFPVMPTNTTAYSLIASNGYGVHTASVSVVVVNGASHPVITEFMALNDTGLLDEDGSTSDWIEIHNPTDLPIDLAQYALTDDITLVQRWFFPSVVVPAKGYLVVFASGKDRVSDPLHTHFKLGGGGEFLALLDPQGQVLQSFSPTFPAQQADISYGILGSDVSLTLFMGVPTPGTANQLTPPPANPVLFSLPDQVFTNGPLLLTLSTTTPGGLIRYTTDGSAPSSTSGMLYEDAIPIADSVVVRAVAYSAIHPPGPIGVGHYLELGPDVRDFNSPLPILVVENFGAGAIPNKGYSGSGVGIVQVPRQGAGLLLYDRDEGGVASFTNQAALITRAGIRVRGSYSSTFPLPPYSVEAWDGNDQEVNIAPLGLPPESDWILYRPKEDIETTLMYNTWTYEVSNQLGHYAVRTRFVEGFVHTNGGELTMANHAGVYVLMERVKRDKNRIDFQPLSPDGSSGGWLLALNRLDAKPIGGEGTPQCFHTAGQNRIQQTPPNSSGQGDDEPRQSNAFINFENPNGYKILPAQRAAIEGWFVPFEDALWSSTWRDPELGYRRYLDTADFIDYYILHNISKNGDGLLISMWMYLENPDAKLKMGPVWDYDLLAYKGDPASDLRHRSDRLWYGRMFTDVDFLQEYIDRWQTHRRGVLATTNLMTVIDRQAAEITAPVAAAHGVSNWAGQVAGWRNWISARCAAIDAQFVPAPQFNHPGGEVTAGFGVALSAPRGEIYYTLDGSDPRAPGGGIAASAIPYAPGGVTTVLLDTNAPATAWVPTDDNLGTGWVAPSFVPSGWTTGLTGAGYDTSPDYDPFINLDLQTAMLNVNASVYVRVPFVLTETPAFESLLLRMRFEDGFVAYLNGIEVASFNRPSTLSWQSTAGAQHSDSQAVQWSTFDLSPHLSQLTTGTNVLALHGLNIVTNSSDLLLLPRIEAGLAGTNQVLEIQDFTQVRARTLDGGAWSGPVEQQFYTGLAVADAGNLVVSEINYHPRPLDADELAAGVTNAEDFEFLELLNISPNPVLLDGVAFTNGIVFDFAHGAVPLLAPGGYTVVAGNPDTFAVRYSTVPADRIAGGFDLATRLSNGGETVTAVGPSGLLREFSYDDVAPWPTAPDGLGRSLTLIAPASNPDHSDPASWRSSRAQDGTPGDSDTLSYPSWKTLHDIVSDQQDDDGDGLTSFAEYAHGTDPGTPDVVSLGLSLGPMIVSGATNTYILTHFAHDLAADDAQFQIEQSTDLLTDIWQGGTNYVDYAGEVVNPDGTAIRSYRTHLPAEAFTNLYLRLRISPR